MFRGSKRAAEHALAPLVADQDREPAVVPDDASRSWRPRTTVKDAIKGWQANGWDDLSSTTVRRYENNWKVHIKDSIGQQQIATFSPYEVERYLRPLKTQGLAKASVRQVRAENPAVTDPLGGKFLCTVADIICQWSARFATLDRCRKAGQFFI